MVKPTSVRQFARGRDLIFPHGADIIKCVPCGYGGIGRRAGFRFLCRKACGFNPHYPYHVGTSCARSDFLFHKKSVTRFTVPPFPQKVGATVTYRYLFCSTTHVVASVISLALIYFIGIRIVRVHRKDPILVPVVQRAISSRLPTFTV